MQRINIDERSIDRLKTNAVMVARLGPEGGEIVEGEPCEVVCNGSRLATGLVNAVFELDGFPDPAGDDMALRGFMADLQKEGLVKAGTAFDSAEGIEAMKDAIARMNERGVGAYRVEYAPQWSPEDGWKETEKINNVGKVPDPDADRFKSAAEIAAEIDSDYANGGTFTHAGNEYTAFAVCQKSGTMQGEAVFGGVEPRIVQIGFDQVRGWKPPLDQNTDYSTVFLESDGMSEDETRQAYLKAVEACRALSIKVRHLEDALTAIADPTRAIVIDLTRALQVIEQTHDPKRNRPLRDIQAHYVASWQLLAETGAHAAAESVCSFDHVVVDNEGLDDVTCKIALATDIDFTDLQGAALSKGKLVYKFSAKGGISASIPQSLKQSSKTPNQPELFSDSDYLPGSGDLGEPEFPKNLLDPNEDTAPGERPADLAGQSDKLGDDGEPLWLDRHGVEVSQGFFDALTDAKQEAVNKWVALMDGKKKGVKKFPIALKPTILNYEQHAEIGRNAFKEGHKVTGHGLDAGSGSHFAWAAGYKVAKESS